MLKRRTAQPVMDDSTAKMPIGTIMARLDSWACAAASVRGDPAYVFIIIRIM